MMIFTFVVLRLDFGKEFIFVNYIMASCIIIFLVVKPKEDVAISSKHLIYCKSSMLKKLSRFDKYPIAKIQHIGYRGFHNDFWEIIDVFNGVGNHGGYTNTLIVNFNDDSSKKIELAISKKDLNRVVKQVYRLKKRQTKTT